MIKRLLLLLTIFSAIPTLYGGTVTGVLQGPSGIPVKNGTLTFTLNQVGLISGTGAIANTTAQCWTDNSGNVVGAPNPLILPNMAANYGSGTVPGGIYYVVTTFLTTSGQSAPSPEAQIQLTGTGSIVIQPPASIPAGVTGINVYIGTASGQETSQGTQAVNAVYTQSTPLAAGSVPPSSNSSICQIAFNDTIIPYAGYNVSLTSASGNSYPGWPQSWQLNGGTNGTVNISQGAPLWNGTVIYPMPIVAQPLNHGPQSISGNLDFGGYNVTSIGNLTSSSINTILYPAKCGTTSAPSWCQGSEIGAWTNSALAQCGNSCEVDIEAGSYTETTSITLPLLFIGNYKVKLLPGAAIQYAGTGCAITTSVQGSGPTESTVDISGGTLIGSPAGQAGVCILPTNTFHVHDMRILEFSNGQGVWLEGPNAGTVDNMFASNNKNGVYATPTYCNGAVCSPLTVANPFTVNAVNIVNNTLVSNSGWGIQYFDNPSASLSAALLVNVQGNDLENNTTGGVLIGRGRATNIQANYFEGDGIGIELGVSAGAAFWENAGALIQGNFFTVTTSMLWDIYLANTADTLIQGNSQNYGGSEGGTNCFINGLTFNAAVSGGELGTVVGKNHLELASVGQALCENGAGVVALTGSGSNQIPNGNSVMQAVNVNYAITSSGTSDTSVPVSGSVAVGSPCEVVPYNATAWNNATAPTISPSAFIATGANVGTLYHPSGVNGLRVSILCANGPF